MRVTYVTATRQALRNETAQIDAAITANLKELGYGG